MIVQCQNVHCTVFGLAKERAWQTEGKAAVQLFCFSCLLIYLPPEQYYSAKCLLHLCQDEVASGKKHMRPNPNSSLHCLDAGVVSVCRICVFRFGHNCMLILLKHWWFFFWKKNEFPLSLLCSVCNSLSRVSCKSLKKFLWISLSIILTKDFTLFYTNLLFFFFFSSKNKLCFKL